MAEQLHSSQFERPFGAAAVSRDGVWKQRGRGTGTRAIERLVCGNSQANEVIHNIFYKLITIVFH
jgi:hypothetical protein